MTPHQQIELFKADLEALFQRYGREFDLNGWTVVAVLQQRSYEMVCRMIANSNLNPPKPPEPPEPPCVPPHQGP